jgi:hypothetical protein
VRPSIADKRSPQDVDEASDTYDTIEWLLQRNPGNNGRVGVMGIFVLGGFGDPHPKPTIYPGRGFDQPYDDSYKYYLGAGRP